MGASMSIADAKAQLASAVRSAEQGHTVIITRRGKAVAALVPAEDVAQLERLRAAGPRAGLAGIAGGWEGSDELADDVATGRRSPPRPTPVAE